MADDLHVVQRHHIETDILVCQGPGSDDIADTTDDGSCRHRHDLLGTTGPARKQYDANVIVMVRTLCKIWMGASEHIDGVAPVHTYSAFWILRGVKQVQA